MEQPEAKTKWVSLFLIQIRSPPPGGFIYDAHRQLHQDQQGNHLSFYSTFLFRLTFG